MPRERSPNRDKAFELFKERGGNITNREIASILGEDEKVIAVWKSRDKWNVVQRSKESCTTKKKGGQPGNKNAMGHGGIGPPGNKNAVKTGEFEALFFNTLNPEEQELLNMVCLDKGQLLLQEIQLLTVREHRMLKRIESLQALEEMQGAVSEDGSEQAPPGMSITKYTSGIEKGKTTQLKECEGILGQIQSIEEALTRVQARRQKAIEALHRFGFDDDRLELETMKFELEMLKQGGQDDETGDDRFLDAMNAAASEAWGDGDE